MITPIVTVILFCSHQTKEQDNFQTFENNLLEVKMDNHLFWGKGKMKREVRKLFFFCSFFDNEEKSLKQLVVATM